MSETTARRPAVDEAVTDANVLMTGFPGFLAGRLIRQLLGYHDASTFTFLVLPKMRDLAERRLTDLAEEFPDFAGRWEVVEGDITAPQLGFSDDTYARLTEQIGVVWHLAALYDLAVAEQVAYRVNVTGTIHVLDFCEACHDLKRLNYVSTCYVSGDRTGLIYERELDRRQGHKNHYEETKFWAEVEVQRRWSDLPTAIFRPGIVVGDSRTGETDKYDGPYYVFQLLDRLPSWMPVPNIGKGDAVVNLVPVDFATEAMAYIGVREDAAHQVYQIADPNPMRARDIQARALEILGRPPSKGALPAKLVDEALKVDAVEETLGVPREALTYFNHDARYDSAHTQKSLKQTDIHCPHLSSYLTTLIDYYLTHPDKGFLDDRRI